ncbi:hypothetical protein VU05_00835 [Desulfobulbus sp. F1]|nr:hypothetical protein [Desulfobulbus sp. F1]
MSTPPKKHDCPILNLIKGCGCQSNTTASSCCGDDHNHPHDHVTSSGNQEKHSHSHDHAHDSSHTHSHETAAASTPPVTAPDEATENDAAPAISAEQEKELLADLQDFDNNPAEFMDRSPRKRVEQAGGTETNLPFFDQAAIDSKAYVGARDELRTHFDANDPDRATRAAFAANDLAQNLVDSYSYTSLQSMQANNLMNVRLNNQPWSDDYWAICRGILGKRYADPGFPNSYDWNTCHNYVVSRPAASVLTSGSTTAINNLSPSEKYDILVGDSNYTLTKKMWAEGAKFGGNVAPWMGICHGWAPASYMLPRPTKAITVLAADGHTQLTFYPSDIKGLASLLWANASPGSKFIGGRCNVENPARDINGRLIEAACFDTNPGTWHLAVVNQIGASKRSMVMDVTFDYEVWNQPVLGYKYRHFNPQSMTYQSSLTAAAVPRANYTRDKFPSYHSSQTVSIVGIEMFVSYMVETSPSHNSSDSPSSDAITEVKYMYDLELDFSGKIIGGEWRNIKHPDFLWTPTKGSRARTNYEPSGTWQSGQSVPSSWRSAAVSASNAAKPAPLAAIVERLISMSNS